MVFFLFKMMGRSIAMEFRGKLWLQISARVYKLPSTPARPNVYNLIRFRTIAIDHNIVAKVGSRHTSVVGPYHHLVANCESTHAICGALPSEIAMLLGNTSDNPACLGPLRIVYRRSISLGCPARPRCHHTPSRITFTRLSTEHNRASCNQSFGLLSLIVRARDFDQYT
jgi:hypothetical protein